MEVSLFLGKVMGLYLIVRGIAVLTNKKALMAMITQMKAKSLLMFSMGMIVVILGLLVVLNHNLWVSDWRLGVTLVGWLVLLKGLLVLFFPSIMMRWAKAWNKPVFYVLGGLICVAVGLYLSYMAF